MANYITQLRAIQKKSNISQAKIADKIGVTVVAVNRWINANATPRKRHLIKIERLYLRVQGQAKKVATKQITKAKKRQSKTARQNRGAVKATNKQRLTSVNKALTNNPLIKYFRKNLEKYKDRQKNSIFS